MQLPRVGGQVEGVVVRSLPIPVGSLYTELV